MVQATAQATTARNITLADSGVASTIHPNLFPKVCAALVEAAKRALGKAQTVMLPSLAGAWTA